MLTSENGEKLLTDLTIDGDSFQQNNSTKGLGVQMDNHLNWKENIFLLSSKVVCAIGYIKHTRQFLPREILKILYLGIFEPQFRFCCSIWGVIQLQNKKVQAIAWHT